MPKLSIECAKELDRSISRQYLRRQTRDAKNAFGSQLVKFWKNCEVDFTSEGYVDERAVFGYPIESVPWTNAALDYSIAWASARVEVLLSVCSGSNALKGYIIKKVIPKTLQHVERVWLGTLLDCRRKAGLPGGDLRSAGRDAKEVLYRITADLTQLPMEDIRGRLMDQVDNWLLRFESTREINPERRQDSPPQPPRRRRQLFEINPDWWKAKIRKARGVHRSIHDLKEVARKGSVTISHETIKKVDEGDAVQRSSIEKVALLYNVLHRSKNEIGPDDVPTKEV